jgi:AcrR family transcriptional regulator
MGRPPRITADQILGAARAAFTARGFAATTLADVAAAIDVTPAAILRYFPSKQDLFAAAMSARGIEVPEFVDELARVDPSSDPRVVLRHFAERMIPFVSTVLRSAIAVQMHAASAQTTVVVPFDTRAEETPPRKGIRIITQYFRRAMNAGVIRRGDPRADALLFVGQLQSYVFIHQVLAIEPAYPLDRYLDALVALWSDGAIVGGRRARKSNRQTSDPAPARPRGGDGGAAVRAAAAKTEAARPRRNARGADGERGVAGRRPRQPRPRR